MNTTETARLASVPRATVSYWAKTGLVVAEDGYTIDDIDALRFVRAMRDRGLSLQRIRRCVAMLLGGATLRHATARGWVKLTGDDMLVRDGDRFVSGLKQPGQMLLFAT